MPNWGINLTHVYLLGKYIAIYNGYQVVLYRYNSENYCSHVETVCDDYDLDYPLSFLHAFTRINESGENTTYLLGLSADSKTTFLWTLTMDANGRLSATSLPRQTLSMSSSPSMVISLDNWTGKMPTITSLDYTRQCVFATYEPNDGSIRYWNLAEDEDGLSWTSDIVVETQNSEIKILKFGAVGIMATG